MYARATQPASLSWARKSLNVIGPQVRVTQKTKSSLVDGNKRMEIKLMMELTECVCLCVYARDRESEREVWVGG